jgi:hypothetical protein
MCIFDGEDLQRWIRSSSVVLMVDASEVSRRGLRRSSMRLVFFADPMERSASPALSGTPTPPRGFLRVVSVFQLAANMGTSVEMIESFYGKKRMRDPKMR